MKLWRTLQGHFGWLGALGEILGPKLRARGLGITALSVLEATLDLLSIGSAVPLLTLAANPDSQTAQRIVHNLEYVAGPLQMQQALLIIAAGIVVMVTMRAATNLLAAWLKSGFIVAIRLHVGKGLLRLYSDESYERQLRSNPSRRLTLVTADASNIASLASDSIAVIASCLTVVAMALMMLILDWRVTTAILVVGAGISGAAYLGLSRRLRELGTEVQKLRMEMATIAARSLQGFQENAIYDYKGTVRLEFEDKADLLGRSLRLSLMLRRLPVIVAQWVLALTVVIGIYVLTAVSNFAAVLPVAVAFAAAALRLGPAAVAAISSAAMLRFHLGSLYDVHKDFCKEAMKGRVVRGHAAEFGSFSNAITFDNVSFNYQRAKDSALCDINADIRQGTMLAVCGPSGSGKSTFVNLMMGLLTPSSGEVCVDSTSIRGRETAWRQLIALVPQDPFFWNSSVRDNLIFGRSIANSDERIWRALEIAHLAAFVRSLPKGLDTPIGERGALVSGGQKQRLAIARALIGEPELLVLDEPTSALDQEIAQAIDDALVDLKGKTTVVIVAHRVASIARCDQVIYFEGGRIAAAGSFNELAETHRGFGRTLGLAHFRGLQSYSAEGAETH